MNGYDGQGSLIPVGLEILGPPDLVDRVSGKLELVPRESMLVPHAVDSQRLSSMDPVAIEVEGGAGACSSVSGACRRVAVQELRNESE